VKCGDWDDYHIECCPGEMYQKTTELDGGSVDLFMMKNKIKELEKRREFEIYFG
jgi:hypothetical protein